MILHALTDYYLRLKKDGLADVAIEGFQKQPIPFVVVVNREGRFVSILDTRSGDGKKKIARQFTVPKGLKRPAGLQPIFCGTFRLCFRSTQTRPQKRLGQARRKGCGATTLLH